MTNNAFFVTCIRIGEMVKVMKNNETMVISGETIKDAALKEIVKPFEKYLKDETVIEICVKKPEEIYVESLDGNWKTEKDPLLTENKIRQIAKSLFFSDNQIIDDYFSSLEVIISEYNIQITMNNYNVSGISLKIRKSIENEPLTATE